MNSKLKPSVAFPVKIYEREFHSNGIPEQILSIQKRVKYYPFPGTTIWKSNFLVMIQWPVKTLNRFLAIDLAH